MQIVAEIIGIWNLAGVWGLFTLGMLINVRRITML